MERLTRLNLENRHVMSCDGLCCNVEGRGCPDIEPNICECLQNVLNKLGEYEDLEEQGLLLRLPRYAYFIKNNKVLKGWVHEVVYCCCRKLLLDIRYDDSSLDSYRGYVGNDVFLTREEAEQKLKEMEG